MNFWIFAFFASIADALKLSLKHDLSQLQKQLSPKEIGQFLHSIKDLPKLAEYLDPVRSPIPFDLLYYYNEYGCQETRIFNMDRTRHIMTCGRLSRDDKSILLNGTCIINWPGLLIVPHHDLSFLLDMVPEANPLLQLSKYKSYEQAGVVFDWSHLKTNHPDRLILFLDKAAKHREDFQFTTSIGNIFKWKIVSPSDFLINSERIHLIGPTAVDECIKSNSTSNNRKMLYINMILAPIDTYNDFRALDFFYWSLNIVNIFKYTDPDLIVSSSSTLLKAHLTKLLKACPVHQIKLIAFLTKLDGLFCEFFDTRIINLGIITEMIIGLTRIEPPSIISRLGPDHQSHNDSMFMAVEFYSWLDYNSQFFEINLINQKKWLKIIGDSLAKLSDPKYRDYFMKFLAHSMNLKAFKKFIENLYEPKMASIELLDVFKRLSWIGCRDKVDFLKSFLSPDLRLNQLKRISYNHRNHASDQSTIYVYLDEDVSFMNSLFEGVFNSILDSDLLVYPLEVDLRGSSFLMEFLKNEATLESVLVRFWKFLGSYNNGFLKYQMDDDDDFDGYKEGYPIEFTPSPWIHPNVLLVIGCVMTLAMLHGIKLTSWSLNKELFDSVFNEISLEPIIEDYSIETEEFFEHFVDEEGNFLNFYSFDDYSLSIGKLLKEKKNKKKKKILKSEEIMSKQYETLSEITKTCLKNYQKKLFDRSTRGLSDFQSARSEEVKIAKLFRIIQDKTSEEEEGFTFDLKDKTSLTLSLLKSIESADEINFSRIDSFVNQITDGNDEEEGKDNDEEDRYTPDNNTRKLFKVQAISLLLGMQPMTRYLTSEEAYKLIFYNE